jgi:hypothetical protein
VEVESAREGRENSTANWGLTCLSWTTPPSFAKPNEAIKRSAVDEILPLESVARAILTLTR